MVDKNLRTDKVSVLVSGTLDIDAIEESIHGMQQNFIQNVVEREKQVISKHIPFCTACAHFEFNEEVERIKREYYNLVAGNTIVKPNFEIKIDLDRYVDTMKYVGNSPNVEKSVVQTTAGPVPGHVTTSHYEKYVCDRGHTLAMEVDLKVFDDREKIRNKKSSVIPRLGNKDEEESESE